MAIVGWLTLVIGAVIASSVWAAAHAIPEGEGIAGQHGRTGYMMLLNVLLRPSLMVMGFFIAVALVGAVSTLGAYMVGQGLINAANHGSEGFLAGLGGPFAFFMALVSTIVIITTTMVIVVHKTFNLVTWLPENVIRWAGGHGDSLAEQSDERRAAGVFASVGSNMGQGAGQMARNVGNGGTPGGDDPSSLGSKPDIADTKADSTPEIADDAGSKKKQGER